MTDWKAVANKAINEFWAQQHPEELAGFLEWLAALNPKPKFIVEIGMARGGNMWALQQAVPDATFIGVDYSLQFGPGCWYFLPGTIVLAGRSGDAKVQATILQIIKPEETLMFFDGSHKWRWAVWQSEAYPAKYHAYHDIHDDRKPWKVAQMYQDNKSQFFAVFASQEHRGGIGVRFGDQPLEKVARKG